MNDFYEGTEDERDWWTEEKDRKAEERLGAAQATEWVDRSVPNIKPGSPEWMKLMTASKVSAIMGHNTYDSWFSLWHKMHGTVESDPETDEHRRGHYLEPAILAWFHDQHPEWTFTSTGMWVHPTARWAAATPDEIGHLPDGSKVLVEAKSSGLDYEWGDTGTDQIPPGYKDQVQWQMFCTGLRRTYVPVITSGLNFAEYVVDFDADYVADLYRRAVDFMSTLRRGEKPSINPLDGHLATYRAIRELNPGILDITAEVEDEHAHPFLIASAEVKAAEERLQAAKNVLAEYVGEAHYVYWGKTKLLTRQSRGGGTPYFVAARGLPIIEKETSNV
jgi:putative phage-type endonuclease